MITDARASELQEIAEACRQVLQSRPQDPLALHRLAQVARATGQPEEALELLSLSLSVDGENLPGILEAAEVLGELGRHEEAVDFYRAAASAAPRDPAIQCQLGLALARAGVGDEARQSLERAVTLAPQFGAGHAHLGQFLQSSGELKDAVASYRRAKRLLPDSEAVMANLGACLLMSGTPDEAIEVLSRGVKKHPKAAGALANLSAAYLALGKAEEAAAAAWKALELEPSHSDALNNLGNAQKAQGRYTEALACFAKARQLQPQCHVAYNNLGSTLSEIGRSEEAVLALRRAQTLRPQSAEIFSNYLFTLNYLPQVDREFLFQEHRRWDAALAAPHTAAAPICENSPDPTRRLRIGYVSADLREHPVAAFIEPVLARHDRTHFEVFCYANHRVPDGVTERLRAQVQHWRKIAALTDDELAAQIRADGIDILVDLSGHTAGNRLLAFARRPAPVQVTMVGYMQTTGLSAMDYRITDENLDPVGVGERFSSENLIRLKAGAATFRPPAQCPDVGPLPAARTKRVTFASFNNLAKVSPEVLAAWAQILEGVPDSRLLIVGRAPEVLRDSLQAAGLTGERVELRERLPMADYLALHQEVDLVLDTFPYNGGTTTLLAAWMGVPFVTLAGPSPVGRAGVNLLRGLGLPQFAAETPADYVERAVEAVRDLPALAALREELRERLRPLLSDGTAYVRELEAAYREMWRGWCAAQASLRPAVAA